MRRNPLQPQTERRLPDGSLQRQGGQSGALDVQQRRPQIRQEGRGEYAARVEQMARDQDRHTWNPARRMVERQASARLHARRTGFRQNRAVVEDRQRQLFRRVHGHAGLEVGRDIVRFRLTDGAPLRILPRMKPFFTPHGFKRTGGSAVSELGPLEREVMELIWRRPDRAAGVSVRDIRLAIDGRLAYTTLMTTLD